MLIESIKELKAEKDSEIKELKMENDKLKLQYQEILNRIKVLENN